MDNIQVQQPSESWVIEVGTRGDVMAELAATTTHTTTSIMIVGAVISYEREELQTSAKAAPLDLALLTDAQRFAIQEIVARPLVADRIAAVDIDELACPLLRLVVRLLRAGGTCTRADIYIHAARDVFGQSARSDLLRTQALVSWSFHGCEWRITPICIPPSGAQCMPSHAWALAMLSQ